MTHDELMWRLAEHLQADPNRMVWTDMPCGMAGSIRPDVFAMQKSFTQPKPRSYEVKVSRSDLESDLRSGKWQGYLEFSSAVVFCFPKGMAKRDEIPKPAGVMTFDETNEEKPFHTLRAPRLGTNHPGWDMMMKLLMDGLDRMLPKRREFNAQRWLLSKRAKQVLGGEVSKALADADYALARYTADREYRKNREDFHRKQWEKERQQWAAEKIAAVEGTLLAAIAEAFGEDWRERVPENLSWTLRRMIADAGPKRARDKLRREILNMRADLESHVKQLTRFADTLTADDEKSE